MHLLTRRDLLLAASTTALGLPARSQGRLDKVTVAGWSKPITEVTPLLVDEDKPFYRAQGIALEYVPGAGGGDAIRNILSGQADVAFTDPGSLFAALDKVTGRISHLEIPMNKTVAFGALKVTPRVCDTRPPTEAPNTASFVEVDEVKLTGEVQRIFTGWMFAESPGLHAVEHPVFDVWLTSCKTPSAPASSASNQNAPAPDTAPASDAAPAPADAAAAARPPAETPPAAAAEPEVLPWATKPPANAASKQR